MDKKEMQKGFIISAVIGAVVASFFTYGLMATKKPNQNEMIKNFYETENAVHVSPHGLRKKMDKGEKDYVLVDLRSGEEYEKEHIIGAISIPAYKTPEKSAYDETDRIVGSFKNVIKENPNKKIIVYCYSTACMTGRKMGKLLAENGIYVKLLGIGWSEWRYGWDMWNHDGEKPVNPKDYIVSGNEPGVPKLKDATSPCTEGNLGC